MTTEQAIKVLEICTEHGDCENCPLRHEETCSKGTDEAIKKVLKAYKEEKNKAIVNYRQRNNIRKSYQELVKKINDFKEELSTARIDFEESLKNRKVKGILYYMDTGSLTAIEEIEKELKKYLQ